MIARHRRTVLPILACCVAAIAIGCQRIPLLAPSGSTITLISGATALAFNGTTQLTAQVIEASGNPPHSGTHVIFTTTLGTIEPSEVETDVSGRAVTTFKAGTGSGVATISASSGGAAANGNNAVKIAVGAAAVGSVTVQASPGTVSFAGGTSTIRATVLDTTGNPLPGIPVTFAADNGSLASPVNTDSNGVAQSVLTTNKTTKVTVTAGVSTTSGTTTTAPPTASVTINVNLPAAITVGTPSPATPFAGQTVSFPITYNTTNATPIARLVVDWGDGTRPDSFGAVTAISHAFGALGSYLVRVTATDTFGDPSYASASVTVGARPQPTVTVSAPAGGAIGVPVLFNIAATPAPNSNTAIASVQVDFGDGTQTPSLGNITSAQHVYQTAGTYTVTAIATDSAGGTGSASTIIVIGGGAINPQFTVTPPSPAAGTVATFNASASTATGTITSYIWTFSDGTVLSGVIQTHSFSTAGTYSVTLTITDNLGNSKSLTKSVIVT